MLPIPCWPLTTPLQPCAWPGKKAGEIRLLLSDVIMPDMNGRELADRLKAELPATEVSGLSF